MTILWIAGSQPFEPPSHTPVFALHDWLQGHWAMLFSHPDDFAPHASTPHGFMACLADEFRRARTKPLALIQRLQQSVPTSWLHHATSDRSLIVVRHAPAAQVVDFAARVLELKIAQLTQPFVLILDHAGRCRSTISYRPRRIDRLRTVQDLLGVAAALRGGDVPAAYSSVPLTQRENACRAGEDNAGLTP